jgi:flagellin
MIQTINQAASETGVTASLFDNGGSFSVDLTAVKYGSNFPINYLETTDILNGGAGTTPAVGNNAVFTVTVPTSNGPQAETFTGGQGPGADGLTMTSPSGNRLVVTALGNSTAGAQLVGQVSVGSMRFQIGANQDQAALFSIPSIFAATLGATSVPGFNLSTIDVTSQQGAQDAMKVIDEAVSQVATLRGNLGSFQKNFLESTVRSLEVAQENLTASESQIRDADIAKEMSEYTRLQVLRQSGIAVLAQANQAPQAVLQLLRGGG